VLLATCHLACHLGRRRPKGGTLRRTAFVDRTLASTSRRASTAAPTQRQTFPVAGGRPIRGARDTGGIRDRPFGIVTAEDSGA
jgi:hypothetical protein